jgi:hypothetical protein
MLHFPEPLTPAATALFQYCLEIAADLVRLDPSEDTWVMGYPRSATCLTRDQACEVFRDLLDALHRPQTYVHDLSLAGHIRVPALLHRGAER